MLKDCIFIIKGGEPAILHPFYPESALFDSVGDLQLQGRFGLDQQKHDTEAIRHDLYQTAEKGLRRAYLNRSYYARLLLSSGVFVAVFLFFSIVIRDPLPILDELLLGLFAAASFYLISERRRLASPGFHQDFSHIRRSLDTMYLHESRIVSVVEAWREECILLGPASFYREPDGSQQFSLMDDDQEEASILCSHFAWRWRKEGLVRELYDTIQKRLPPGKLIDRLVKKHGLQETALILSYMRLLKAIDDRRLTL